MFDWIFKWGCFFLGLIFAPVGLFILFSDKGLSTLPGRFGFFSRYSIIGIYAPVFNQIVSGLFWLILGLFLVLIGLTYKPPPDPPDE
jgi:hypothetical protein